MRRVNVLHAHQNWCTTYLYEEIFINMDGACVQLQFVEYQPNGARGGERVIGGDITFHCIIQSANPPQPKEVHWTLNLYYFGGDWAEIRCVARPEIHREGSSVVLFFDDEKGQRHIFGGKSVGYSFVEDFG